MAVVEGGGRGTYMQCELRVESEELELTEVERMQGVEMEKGI